MSVKCGDCKHFIRDGKCNWHNSADSKRADRPFAHAPFWVWSDCYSDKEQVRSDVTSACPTFETREVAALKTEGR
jgi:hypothetical protein